MKKILCILAITLAMAANKVQAQTPVTDTLAYLQSIVSRKAEFVGKPFSVLMDSLKTPIKYFHQKSRNHDISKETSTRFAFYFPQAPDDLYLTFPSIEVYWEPYLNATQSYEIRKNNSGGGWNAAAITFYSTAIIADIKLRAE